jgi:ankyrin repeat protein
MAFRKAMASMCWAGWLMLAPAAAGPLHDAARAGEVAVLAQLLADGASLEERNATGETPLQLAALAGHVSAVELLLAKGAALDARNDRGLTALHAAAYGGHSKIAGLLIDRGAAVNDADNRFHTTPLIVAAEDGHTEVVKLLIAKGADLEAAEANRFTALTQAWAVEKWDTVDALLAAGAKCQPKEIVGELWAMECIKRKKQ